MADSDVSGWCTMVHFGRKLCHDDLLAVGEGGGIMGWHYCVACCSSRACTRTILLPPPLDLLC
uniref:Uncharacterized protein n=1 Tax=Anguilla anguilla TaxID=7936 RepID=A0A0E9RLH6_ANGAN